MRTKSQPRTLFFVVAAALSVLNPVSADNPIISHKYTADPSALVSNGRVYVYCSHDDNNNNGYDIVDYTLISSDDMVNWTDHGEIFNAKKDTKWANLAFAPSCIERDGNYYLYFPDGGNSIGVAVADKPEGPFTDPAGKSIVNKSMPNCNVEWCFDPCTFLDDDGEAYLSFGGGSSGVGTNLRIIKLGSDLVSTSGNAVTVSAQSSFEASYIHKYNNKYYFSYSTNGASKIDYLMSDKPMEGYKYTGTVLPQPPKNPGTNNHASIVKFVDKWYIFYHDRRVSNSTYFRSVSVDLVTYNADGTMKQTAITDNGPPQIKAFNPYDTVQAETIWKQKGIKTAACSEGGIMLTSIAEGDYTSIKGADFGDGAKSFEARVASASGGGTIEVRLDSEKGTLAGSCKVEATGGWTTWETVSCDLNGCSGAKNIYFVYKGSGEPFRVNWYRFIPQSTSLTSKRTSYHIVNRAQWYPVTTAGLYTVPTLYGTVFSLSGRRIKSGTSQTDAAPAARGLFIVKSGNRSPH